MELSHKNDFDYISILFHISTYLSFCFIN